MTDLIHN